MKIFHIVEKNVSVSWYFSITEAVIIVTNSFKTKYFAVLTCFKSMNTEENQTMLSLNYTSWCSRIEHQNTLHAGNKWLETFEKT